MTAPDDTSPDSDDAMTRMLTASAPRTIALTPAVEDELARMSVAARTDTKPAASRKRLTPRVAAVALAGVLVLGGAGAAAAATGGWWSSWWAAEPDGVAHYTLPSGTQCEHRIGGLMIGMRYEHIREFARDWYATADLDAIVADGVDEHIAAARADMDRWFWADDGTRQPAWYGTEHYPSPDQEYLDAAQQSISAALNDALEDSDLDLTIAPEGRGLEISGEISCPGADW
jgi:hypothetical protein